MSSEEKEVKEEIKQEEKIEVGKASATKEEEANITVILQNNITVPIATEVLFEDEHTFHAKNVTEKMFSFEKSFVDAIVSDAKKDYEELKNTSKSKFEIATEKGGKYAFIGWEISHKSRKYLTDKGDIIQIYGTVIFETLEHIKE